MTRPTGHARTDSNGQRSDPPACLDAHFAFLEGTLREVQEKIIQAMMEARPMAEQFATLKDSPDRAAACVHELVTEAFWEAIKAAKEKIAEYGFEGEVWEPQGSKRFNGRAAA